MTSDNIQSEAIVFLNGEYLPESQAKISVFDHVVLYGDGVFDTMCAWNHGVFKLDEHVNRLYESAHAIKLAVPYSKTETKRIILETVHRNRLANAYIKMVITRGIGARPLLNPYNCVSNVFAFAIPYISLAGADGNETGIRMMVSSMRRVPNECMSTKIKSCNYLNHVLMRLEANEAGVDDAIELDLEGYVCEAPGYNIFLVKHGTLVTPTDNILLGITRDTVLDLARAAKIPVDIRRVQTFDLYNADEVFLSSTAGGIVPVIQLDGRTIGNGKMGRTTKAIRDRYQSLLESCEKSTLVLARNSSSSAVEVNPQENR